MRTKHEIERIVQENAGLVSTLVGRTLRLFPRLPGGYDREDLYSLGNLGLLSAARTFDPERGVAFSTYAYRCIDHAIAGVLKREWNQQIHCISLSQVFTDEEDNPLEDQIADSATNAVADALSHFDRDILEKAIARLPEREAQVIRLLYFEGESVLQVAKQWRVTSQAVQNMHLRSLKALRLQLRHLGIREWDN
jgi:RNA polymerase sigma factor (sigma-70 family)